jgi:hypothetical protein
MPLSATTESGIHRLVDAGRPPVDRETSRSSGESWSGERFRVGVSAAMLTA